MSTWSGAFPSKYISSGDLDRGRRYKAQIRSVQTVEVFNPKTSKHENKICLFLRCEYEFGSKGLLIGKRRAESLRALFGDEIEGCVHGWIEFWVEQRNNKPEIAIGDKPVMQASQPAAPANMGDMELPTNETVSERLLTTLSEEEFTLDNLISELRISAYDCFELVHGKEIVDWPGSNEVLAAIAAAIKTLKDKRHKADTPDPVDTSPDAHKSIDEDDIPF